MHGSELDRAGTGRFSKVKGAKINLGSKPEAGAGSQAAGWGAHADLLSSYMRSGAITGLCTRGVAMSCASGSESGSWMEGRGRTRWGTLGGPCCSSPGTCDKVEARAPERQDWPREGYPKYV